MCIQIIMNSFEKKKGKILHHKLNLTQVVRKKKLVNLTTCQKKNCITLFQKSIEKEKKR